jgi:hypothetical protein
MDGSLDELQLQPRMDANKIQLVLIRVHSRPFAVKNPRSEPSLVHCLCTDFAFTFGGNWPIFTRAE